MSGAEQRAAHIVESDNVIQGEAGSRAVAGAAHHRQHALHRLVRLGITLAAGGLRSRPVKLLHPLWPPQPPSVERP